jgi:hypothetical protein
VVWTGHYPPPRFGGASMIVAGSSCINWAEDDAYWFSIRHQLRAQVDQMTRQRAESLILAHLNSRGPTAGARSTALWFKLVFVERCAA